MNIAVNHSPTPHENTLIWAIICSVLLHGLFVIMVPNIKFDDIKMPETLTVDLVKIPEPPPAAMPEPVQPPPEVVKPKIEPKIKPTPKPVIKPQPVPAIEKNEVAPEPPPAQPTEVIAVAPQVNAPPPVETVQAPIPVKQEPPPPPAPSQADIDDAKGRYGNSLWSAISKHKSYPKIARMRSWTGEAIVELALDGNGKLKSKKIVQSSGHDVLDRQALEMVEKALPFPAPPETLRGTSFTITVPVPFKLE